jgi:predicted nucleic acid-binding protein
VNRTLVDTSALLTLLDADDPRHEATRAALIALRDDDLVTHGYVVAETIAVVRRRFGVDGVTALIDDLLPIIGVLPVDGGVHERSLARYRASLPSGTSFVDQVTMTLLDREAITTVFALDRDLAGPGITLVPSVGDGTGQLPSRRSLRDHT